MKKKESIKNIGLVCVNCAPRPNPKYLTWPIESFVGRYIKSGFKVDKPGGTIEHLWVHITGIENDTTLMGTVDNDPILEVGLASGDEVFVGIKEIEDVYQE